MKKFYLLLALPILLFACNPKGNSSTTGEKPAKLETSMDNPPGVIHFTGSGGKMNKDFKGTFDKWRFKEFSIPSGDYSKISAIIEVDVASVNVNPDGLENHLRQDDYLNAVGFPTATIIIDGAQQPRGKSSWVANGSVSLNGMLNETVSIDFEVLESKPVQIKGSTALFRKDYKVGSMESEKVKNKVPIEFQFTVPN